MTPNNSNATTDDVETAPEDADATDRATETDGTPADNLEELQSRLDETEDNWRRTSADLDNLRKRCARDIAHARDAERARVAAMALPVIDNLDLALGHAQADPAALVEGVRVIRDQALALLEGLGFRRQGDVGIPFDPQRHEVVSVVEDPHAEPGTVVAVTRPGYGEGSQQLRPASVVVARQSG